MFIQMFESILALLLVVCMQGFVISSFNPNMSLFWYSGERTITRGLLIWGVAMLLLALLNIVYYILLRK
jgi:hypothetical protein